MRNPKRQRTLRAGKDSALRPFVCHLLPLAFACSVFPDQAVLPSAAGGAPIDVAGGSLSTGGRFASGGSTDDRGGGGTAGTSHVDDSGGTPATAGNAGDSSNTTDAGSGGALAGEAGATSAGAAGESTAGGSCRDATELTLDASADAYVSEADTKTNFGKNPALYVSGEPDARANALVSFDLSAAANLNVSRAELVVTLRTATDETAHTLSALAVAQTWREDKVSWLSAGPGANWSTPGGDTNDASTGARELVANSPAGTSVTLDLTADVLAIQRGDATNDGWLLAVGVAESPLQLIARESSLSAERPKLVITACP